MKKDLSAGRPFLVPLLVVVAIIILIPTVIMPQIERIQAKNLEVQSGSDRLSRLEEKLEVLDTIDEQEDLERLVELEKIVPTGRSPIAPLVVGLRTIAAGSGLKVDNLSLSPGKVATQSATNSVGRKKLAAASSNREVAGENSNRVILSMDLSGGQSNFQIFLQNIEKAKRLLGIQNTKAAAGDSEFRFQLELGAPFTGFEGGSDAIANPLPELDSNLLGLIDKLKQEFVDYTNITFPPIPLGNEDPFR
jgi:hypothetical protein